MRPELVIFDCDGVLVDTETIANTFMAEIITERGLDIDMETSRRRFTGMRLSSVRDKILAEDGIDLGEDFTEVIYASLPKIFGQGVKAIPHVREAAEAVQAAAVPYCVASSGKIEKMHLTLGAANLLPLFEDVLFSGWDVENGKPAPDIFLHAAEKMGHKPENCVVVEDSVSGVQAGVAAGMKVFGYCGDPLADTNGLVAAGAINFDDMRQLPELLNLL